jgi:hypothetical protein
MVSNVQRLKKLIDVKVGNRKVRTVENAKVARAVDDALELLALRNELDRQLEAKERLIAAFLERFDVPRGARQARLRVGGRGATVRFWD